MNARRVYYTGDMANTSGWFTAESLPNGLVRLTEEVGGENRCFTLQASHVGDIYRGHCNPRFVTEEAYKAYFALRQVRS